MKRATLVFIMGLVALSARPAWADCVSECQMSCFGGGESESEQTACIGRENVCQTQCYGRQKRPSVVYGAIAYGAKSTAYGYAYDKNTADAARATALGNCNQHGDDCKLVANYSNACAAVAAQEERGAYSMAQGKTSAEAQRAAMGACTLKHGPGCQIEVWSCSFP